MRGREREEKRNVFSLDFKMVTELLSTTVFINQLRDYIHHCSRDHKFFDNTVHM